MTSAQGFQWDTPGVSDTCQHCSSAVMWQRRGDADCRCSFQNERGTCVQELFTCIVSSEKEGGKRQRKTKATLTPRVSEFKG